MFALFILNPFQLEGSAGIAAGSAIHEVEVIGTERRRTDAGHNRRILFMKAVAHEAGSHRRRQLRFDRVDGRGRAGHGEAQAVVVLAEICVGREFATVGARLERSDR